MHPIFLRRSCTLGAVDATLAPPRPPGRRGFFQRQSRNWIAATIAPSAVSRTSRPAPIIASKGLASTSFPPSQIGPQSSHQAGGGLSGIFGHGGKSDPEPTRPPLFDPDQRRAGSFVLSGIIVTKALSWPHCSKCKRPLSLVPAKSGGRVIRCDFCDSHDPSDNEERRDSNASRKDID